MPPSSLPRGSQHRSSAGALPAATLEALRRGEPEAFREVYELHRARLYAFLLRLTRDPQLASDLSQETWLRLAANARQLSPETEPGAWLFRVARNLFISQRRWAIVQEAGKVALRTVLGHSGPRSPLEAMTSDRDQRKLERALAGLPLRYREVVLLVSIEGWSAQEVADMLDLQPATVRQRLARGRAALKKALADKDDNEAQP
jgi:RNA polymerase sigma-70 factor (ECF subfamily)